jgi:UrcA family protein
MSSRNIKTLGPCRGRAVTAIFGILTLSFGIASFADDGNDVRKVTVKFADLNVSTPEGAATLYSRIRTAAKTVCAPTGYELFPSSGVNDCIQKAIAGAVTKVNQTSLYAVYNEHYRKPLPKTLLSQSR